MKSNQKFINQLINETNMLNKGGFYGANGLGDPDEYDNLKICLANDVVEIEFYNRGSTLFSTDDLRDNKYPSFNVPNR